jgi:ABC-type multidrug transport system fused ATPase/permease subunit
MNFLRQVWAILVPAERRGAMVLLALMLAGTAMEMISIGLVVPVLAFMTGSGGAVVERLRQRVALPGGAFSPGALVLVLGGLVAIYAVKSLYLMAVAYRQSRFITAVQAHLSRRLFKVFMAQPWTFHLQRNSAGLMHLVNETQGLTTVCVSLVQLISELLVGTGLLALLLWFEPFGTVIVAGTLGLAFWAFNRFVRSRSRLWAEARQLHTRLFRQHMQQGLAGAKEVKLHGCESEFIEQFSEHADSSARFATLQWAVEQAPRMWFEWLAVVALFLLAATMVWLGNSTKALVPMLGLYAAVAFRILPSINHAAVAIQKLRNAEPVIESLQRNLALERSLPTPGPVTLLPFRDAIRLEHVSYRYSGKDEPVLHDVGLRIPQGLAVGFIGESGAGKSTLVDVLLGLLTPSSGRVTVDGVDIQDNLRGWQEIVGYVPQSIYLVDSSIRRNVAFGVPERVIDDEAVRRALAAAQLADFIQGLPEGIDTVVGERGVRLSGGQRQRIAIARALYHDPQVLVLDEATSALDADTEREVMAAVEALHGTKTLVIVAHRLSTVACCDVLHRLEGGRIVSSCSLAEVAPADPCDAR